MPCPALPRPAGAGVAGADRATGRAQSMEGVPIARVAALLRGPPGSRVSATFRRPAGATGGEGVEAAVMLTREAPRHAAPSLRGPAADRPPSGAPPGLPPPGATRAGARAGLAGAELDPYSGGGGGSPWKGGQSVIEVRSPVRTLASPAAGRALFAQPPGGAAHTPWRGDGAGGGDDYDDGRSPQEMAMQALRVRLQGSLDDLDRSIERRSTDMRSVTTQIRRMEDLLASPEKDKGDSWDELRLPGEEPEQQRRRRHNADA
jgi:hypothetical protein